MEKFIKYLFTLLLVFGQSINDGFHHSGANFNLYRECSNVAGGNESDKIKNTLYRFGQRWTFEKILLKFLVAYQELDYVCSNEIKVILRIQQLISIEIESFATRFSYPRLATYKIAYPSLYIA